MKPTKEHIEAGKELAKRHGVKQLFVNENSEFFTSHNAASLSVGHDKDKFAEVPLTLTAKEVAAANKEVAAANKEAAAKEAAANGDKNPANEDGGKTE